MRHLGSLEDEQLVLRFHDYMLARGIPTKMDREGKEWALWVVEEDDVEKAREELEAFVADPEDPKYVDAARAAQHIRKSEERRQRQFERRQRTVRRQMSRTGTTAVTSWLVAISIAFVAVTVDWRDPLQGVPFGRFTLRENSSVLRAAFIVPPQSGESTSLAWSRSNLFDELATGQLWRLVTPIFIHFSPLHLIFNLLMLQRFGGAVEFRKGWLRLLGMVLVIAVTSNVGQYVVSGPAFGGMSGVVYGLFGYIWARGRYHPEDDLAMPPNLAFLMMAWFVICFSGAVGAVANTAHAAGLGMGCLLGYLPIRQPRRS